MAIQQHFADRHQRFIDVLPHRDSLCLRAACPIFWPLDRTVRANGVITLATGTDKDDPTSKRPKGMVDKINHHLLYIYHSWPTPRRMLTVREVDPSYKASGVDTTSYYELKTLPDKWVVLELRKSLELPPDPLMSSSMETASWHFDETTYSWIPRLNH
ncbi:hypothetical protein HAX54_025660 [Datura stramonium]|uniref:Uncharacterized protein n=1 Tax=Datura stramonium TaxID=4076 RepID=A0ABS8S758_DATST|nr:hypothetical protein [Datura stramonium]